MNNKTKCRLCHADLSVSPQWSLSNYPAGVQYFLKEEEIYADKGVTVNLFCCESCGFVQLPPTQVLYTDGVTAATSNSPAMKAHRLDQIRNLVNRYGLKEGKILDIGCGDGHILEMISSLGAEGYGIEPSNKHVEEAKNKGLRVEQGYVAGNKILSNSPFDAFVSFHVMEHIPDLSDFLRGIRVNLADGGVGLVEVPSLESIIEFSRVYEIFPDHLNYFSLRSLKNVFELSNFEVLEANTSADGAHNIVTVRKLPLPCFESAKTQMEEAIKALAETVHSAHKDGKEVAIWGAGCQNLILLSQSEPLPIKMIVDSAKYKQGLFTPVSHLRIESPEKILSAGIDVVIITAPWYESEICQNLKKLMFNGAVYSLRGNKFIEVTLIKKQ